MTHHIIFNLLTTITLLSICCHIIFLIIFKKKDVNFVDIFFKIPMQHGALWLSRKPEVYFKQQFLKYILIPLYVGITSIVLLMFLGILSFLSNK